MQFFEQQRLAKQNTLLLIWLFIIAVILISGLTAFALKFAWIATVRTVMVFPTLHVGVGVAFVVSAASLIHTLSMGEGPQLAERLGGEIVPTNTSDPKLKQVINILEEMSIASGVPIPWLYVLKKDKSINAFAAGFDLNSSAMGITQGAVDHLNRDELQGVIAHEMSHILNGDMRLNMYLAGAISGLVMISQAGRAILKFDSGGRRKRGGGFGLFGAVLFVFGMLGVFISRVIQALISRQREFLADASSSQFTRNPMSLASALSKIANHYGSMISSSAELGLSHIFFSASGKISSFASFLSTHPSPEDRVARLLPQIKPEKIPDLMSELGKEIAELPIDVPKGLAPKSSFDNNVMQSVGILSRRHLEQTQQNFSSMPSELRAYVHNPEKSLRVLRILMSETYLSPQTDAPKELLEFIRNSSRNRIILIQLSLNSLRSLSVDQRLQVFSQLEKDALSDQRLTASEKILLLMAHDMLFVENRTLKRRPSVEQVNRAVGDVIRIVCGMNEFGEPVSAETLKLALSEASKQLGIPIGSGSVSTINHESLEVLRALPIKYREKLLQVLWTCVNLDGSSESYEIEILRVICLLIRIPVPPVLDAA